VLYALALEQIFPDAEVDAGRLYYCTSRGGFRVREVPLEEQARAAVKTVFETIDSAIERGFFPAAPALGACERCNFRSVCGPYEELRVAQVKSRKPLEALTHLRGLP